MYQQLSQPENHSSHPRDNSIPSEENSQQSKRHGNRGGRPPRDKFALKNTLYIFAVLLCASIANGDFRSAVLNAIIGYVIVYSLDRLRKALKK